MSFICLILLFIGNIEVSSAQQDKRKERKEKKEKKEDKNLIAIPFVASNPETSLIFGGIGVFQKNFTQVDSLRKSFIQLGFFYSLRNQFAVFFEPDIFFKEEKYRIRGNASYRFEVDKYWGVGDDTPQEAEELVEYRVVRFTFGFYKKINEKMFAGFQTRFDDQSRVELVENSILASDDVGSFGSRIFGIGPTLLIDTRNQNNNPIKGYFLEVSTALHHKNIGSQFNFNQVLLDYRQFKKISKGKDHILAFRTYALLNFGKTPWKQMAVLGSDPLRGYFNGRFRDNNMVATQVEYRSPLLFWRIGMVGFVGVGQVFGDGQSPNFDNLKPSYGGGIRFMVDKVDRLNIRIDYALGTPGNTGLYFGFQEAF